MSPGRDRMARALVTGGAGFIGSHLVDELVATGHAVTVLDNFSTGSAENLREDPQLTVIRGSVLDAESVDRLVAQHDIVYHLAAAVGVRHIVDDPLSALLTNVRGTENVLASAHKHGRRVLLASTSEIYGRSDRVPFQEDTDRVLGPTWVHRWSYSTSKAIDEHLAFAYAERGLHVSVVRYFNSYGPRIDESGYGSVIARFASQAIRGQPITVHGDGKQTRCFTYVSDTVRGTMLAASLPSALGQALNIGSAREVSIYDLATSVRAILNSPSQIALVSYDSYYPKGFQDTPRRVPDVKRALEVLGFSAEVDLEHGLARTLAWCRQHFDRPRVQA